MTSARLEDSAREEIARRRARGFTLLEVVVATVVLGVLLGGALSFVAAADRFASVRQCSDQLSDVAEALRRYVDDTDAWPPDLDALSADPGVAGWRGPYLTASAIRGAGEDVRDYRLDPWRRQLTYTAPADVAFDPDGLTVRAALVTSAGPDRTIGTADDIERQVHASSTPTAAPLERDRRADLTRERLRRLNEALGAYQKKVVTTASPLTNDAAATLVRLRDAGYIESPIAQEDQKDAWGVDFYMDGLRFCSRMLVTGSEPLGAQKNP